MAVTLDWEDAARTVIRVTFHNQWTWDNALTAKAEAGAMLDMVDHQVSLMVCWENENWMPGDYQNNMRMIANETHPRLKQVVLVRSNTVFQQFFRLFKMLYHVPFEFTYVKTVEAARAMLFPVSKTA